MKEEVLFEIQNVSKHFSSGGKTLKAVDGVSLELFKGETFGLVGESGCGKSTFGRTLVRLYDPTSGEIVYKGKSTVGLKKSEAKAYTSQVQMIFQDPYASLNPRMTIGDIIKEGMKIHHIGAEKEQTERMYELLELVGLNREHAQRFPYEFSGGQRQRVGIARALAVNPEFIVCDEPISALDVSIQAQIVNLLKKLQSSLDLTYLFISHDLSIVRYISDRVGVMYLGSLVEVGQTGEVFINPIHPYTIGLLSAIPVLDPQVEQAKEELELDGDVPSPIDVPKGCKFAGRCRFATERCRQECPKLEPVGEKGRQVACFRVGDFMKEKEAELFL